MFKIENPIKRRLAAVVDPLVFIFYKAFCLLGKGYPLKKGLQSAEINKILVIRLDHIGDVILTSPVFKALRNRYPHAEIVAMVGSWSVQVLENNKRDINRLMVYDAPWWKSVRPGEKKQALSNIAAFFRMILLIRKEKFDLAIEPRGDFRQIFFFGYLADVKYALSFDRSGGAYLLSENVPFEEGSHELDKSAMLLQRLGIADIERSCSPEVTKEDKGFSESFIKERSLENKKIVVIAPGARVRLKTWPESRFIELTKWLLGNYRDTVVLFLGSKGEEKFSELLKFTLTAEVRAIDLIGKTSITQTYALLNKSSLIISHDGPVSHMASSLEVPAIVLFGPTSQGRFKPYGNHIIALQKKYDCSPCLLKNCRVNKDSRASLCMEAISIGEVKDVIKEVMT